MGSYRELWGVMGTKIEIPPPLSTLSHADCTTLHLLAPLCTDLRAICHFRLLHSAFARLPPISPDSLGSHRRPAPDSPRQPRLPLRRPEPFGAYRGLSGAIGAKIEFPPSSLRTP